MSRADLAHSLAIKIVVDRIGLGLADDAGIDHILGGDQADLRRLGGSHRDQFGVGRRPQPVAFETEIFEPQAAHAGSGTISGDQEPKFCTRPTFTTGS